MVSSVGSPWQPEGFQPISPKGIGASAPVGDDSQILQAYESILYQWTQQPNNSPLNSQNIGAYYQEANTLASQLQCLSTDGNTVGNFWQYANAPTSSPDSQQSPGTLPQPAGGVMSNSDILNTIYNSANTFAGSTTFSEMQTVDQNMNAAYAKYQAESQTLLQKYGNPQPGSAAATALNNFNTSMSNLQKDMNDFVPMWNQDTGYMQTALNAVQSLAGLGNPSYSDIIDAINDMTAFPQQVGSMQKFMTQYQTDGQTCATDLNKLSSALIPHTPGNNDYSYLQIEGVTYEIVNGLYIPIGGEPYNQGDQGHSASEAWGYALRNAVNNGDLQTAQQLLNSFFHFALTSNEPGLMGWEVNQSTGEYDPPTSNNDPKNSATDADEDIISSMLDLLNSGKNLTIDDPQNPSNSGSLSDIVQYCIQSFAKADCSQEGLNGGSYGQPNTHPDYLDPVAFQKMINYENSLGTPDSKALAGQLLNSLEGEMNNIAYQVQMGGSIFDSYGPPGGQYQNSFSAESLRFLMRMGQYLTMPGVDTTSVIYHQAVYALSNTVNYLFENNQVQIQTGGSYPQISINGMGGGQSSATLLLAVLSLQKIGQLPSSVTPAIIQQLTQGYYGDMNSQFQNLESSNAYDYQNSGNYFGLQLLNLCQSIMGQNGITPPVPT